MRRIATGGCARESQRVKALLLLCCLPALASAQVSRPAPSATSESSRLGAEYFVQRSGASWTYQLDKGKGHVTITSFIDWKAQVSIAMGGKLSGGATWRVKEGVWLERTGLRGEHEAIILPASMSRGTRWQDVASIERGGGTPSSFEVVALEAQVELPTGITVEHCLAVLEMPEAGGPAYTHYYAPNIGKVAVQGPDGWVYRLIEFRSGGKGHAE